MRDVLILLIHLVVTVVRLARPGGLRSVLAESLLVKHQLGILNRGPKRAPNLRAAERFIVGLCTVFMNPARVLRSAIVLKPSTLLHLSPSKTLSAEMNKVGKTYKLKIYPSYGDSPRDGHRFGYFGSEVWALAAHRDFVSG